MKLKRFLSLAVAMAMVFSIVPAFGLTASAAVGDTVTIGGIDYSIVGENLVPNGTFEENADGWHTWDGSKLGDLVGVSVSSEKAHSGSQSLKVTESGGSNDKKGNFIAHFSLGDNVAAGDKYVLSLWINNVTGLTLTTGLGNTEGSNQVDIDCGGLGNGGEDPISCNISGLTADSWNKVTYVLTAKEDSKFAEVFGRWALNAYIDDVELYKVEQVSTAKAAGEKVVVEDIEFEVVDGTNLITNGSFENAEGNFDTTGWLSQKSNADIPNPQTAGDDHFIAGNTYGFYFMGTKHKLGEKYNRWGDFNGPRIGNPTDGNWYFMSQWDDGFEGLCAVKRSFALESGKNYVFMYDIKSNKGNFNASTVYVSTSLAANTGTAAGEITEDWKTVSYFVQATDTVNTLWFNAYGMQKNGTCLDNFRLYEVKLPPVSTEGTVKKAFKEQLSLPLGTKTDLTLPTSVTDIVGTELTVDWTSSNTEVMANDGTVTNPEQPVTLTMTPSTTILGDTTVTGEAETITVFPTSRKGGEYRTESAVYTLGEENLVEAANVAASFEKDGAWDIAGWKSHTNQNTNVPIDVTEDWGYAIPDGQHAYGSMYNDDLGQNYCTIYTLFPVMAGTNYISFYARLGIANDAQVYTFFTTDNSNVINAVPAGAKKYTLTNEWVRQEAIVEAETDGYVAFLAFSLNPNRHGTAPGVLFDDFEVYAATEDIDASATVTVNYYIGSVAEENLYKSVPVKVLKGNAASFDAVEVLKDGTFYTTDAVSYEDVQENAGYDVVLTAVENRITASTTFSWNFRNNSRMTGFGGDHGDIKSDSNILTIGWNDPRGGVIAFDIKPESGKAFGNAELKMNVPYFGGGDPTLYAVDSSYLNSDNYSLNYDGSALTYNDAANTTPKIVADMGGYAIGTITGGGDQSVTFDLGEYFTKFPSADKVLIIALATSGQIYGYGNDAEKFGTMVPSLAYESMYTALGVQIEDGAQVRIGGGIDADGKIDVLEESGLRFAATVNGTDSMVADMVSGYIDDDNNYGILIYPSDVTITDFNAETDKFVAIPAQVFQDAEKTKFTAALTNLKVENYNRMFTAKPYVKKDGVYYTDDNKTERSVYQVAAGLLTDEAASGLLTENTVNVLNAYLNQVGVRLTYAADGAIGIRTEGVGAYTGVEFFTVASDGADGVYTVTLTAKGNATFKNFWNEYVRVNNNHTQVVNGIGENAAISEDGKTLTFTFTPGNVK